MSKFTVEVTIEASGYTEALRISSQAINPNFPEVSRGEPKLILEPLSRTYWREWKAPGFDGLRQISEKEWKDIAQENGINADHLDSFITTAAYYTTKFEEAHREPVTTYWRVWKPGRTGIKEPQQLSKDGWEAVRTHHHGIEDNSLLFETDQGVYFTRTK